MSMWPGSTATRAAVDLERGAFADGLCVTNFGARVHVETKSLGSSSLSGLGASMCILEPRLTSYSLFYLFIVRLNTFPSACLELSILLTKDDVVPEQRVCFTLKVDGFSLRGVGKGDSIK